MNIDRFVELNKGWLDKFNYNSYADLPTNPSWWNGNVSWFNPEGIDFTFEHSLYFSFINWDNKNGDSLILEFDTDEFTENKLENYFINWKQPTQEEKDYFEMIEGFKIPWSEEHPFILEKYK